MAKRTKKGAAAAAPTPSTDADEAPPVAKKTYDHRVLEEKLGSARAKLLFLHPFFGYLVTNLEDKLGTEWLPTAGTDGHAVHWSDEFLDRLTLEDTMFVMAHEAMHCALQHLWRRSGRDPMIFNWACDCVVNDMLLAANLGNKLSPELSNMMLKGAEGKSAEELYDLLMQNVKKNGGKGQGSSFDNHDGWSAKNADPRERNLSDVWRASLAQASKFGKLPAGMERHIEGILRPKRDWRDLLRDGLSFPEDYRWVPTDRRFPEVLLPTLTGEIHRVVVAVDTSGSIFGEKLLSFWTELVAILRNNRCEARVLTCDAEVQDEFDENGFDPAAVHRLKGGGGTSFVPVFERVERYIASGWQPEAAVYLTDLDGEFPSRVPDVRTIWVVEREDRGAKNVPFGEVIVLE